MRTTILGAATAALFSTTALVSAQTTKEPRADQPGMKEQGATPGASTTNRSSDQDKAGDAKRTAEPKDKAEPRQGQDKGRSAEDSGKDPDRKGRVEKSDSQEDRKGAQKQTDQGKDRTAEPKAKANRDKDKAAETKDRAGVRQQDTARDRDDRGKQRDQAREGKDRDRDQAREGKDRDRDRDQARGKDAGRNGDRVTLSQTQRTNVREKLSRHREARVTNVNFSINIGTRVPRDFRLHVIPADIVAVVPAYRGYRYFIVEERVVIVHPTRYEIVEVIEVDGPRRGGSTTATLTLTPAQRALIVRHVPNERVSRDVNINLALGAEIDRRVELYEFPGDVVAQVPDLKSYRYVVLERQIAVVEPSNRTVIEVIER